MKYLKQFGIILSISFIGEILNAVIPLPVPASIYGIVIMFVCLMTGVIKIHQVKETGKFLVDTMPIMFVPPSVALLESWGILKPVWFQYVFISLVTTIIVMGAAGWSAQLVIRFKRRKGGGSLTLADVSGENGKSLAAADTSSENGGVQ